MIINNSLNKLIWDDNDSLKESVKEKILYIVDNFVNYIGIPINIIDIWLVGSNASYNYSKDSDLDVHIIANYSNVSDNSDLMNSVYNIAKSSYNKTHDIKIYGINVELYVQDVNSGIESNGIYSIKDNDWIKKPKQLLDIKIYNIDQEFKKWENHINDVLNQDDYNVINDTINNLYNIRINSIAVDGEYGKGNQLFKALRSKGYLQKLKDKLVELEDKKLSLESLTRGQLVNLDI